MVRPPFFACTGAATDSVLEICLLLYSQLNTLVQVFKFSVSADDPTVPISVCDPSILSLPFSGSSGANIEDCVPVRSFSSIFLREIEETAIPDPSNESETLILFKFIGQGTSSGIVEALYSARTKSDNESGKFVPMDSIPPMVGKKPVSILSSTRAGDDDFVVNDDYEPAALLRVASQRKSVRRAQHAEKWLDQHVTVSGAVTSFLVHKMSGSQGFNDWLSLMSSMLRETIHDGSDISLPKTMFVRPPLHLSGSRLIGLGSISSRAFPPLTILTRTLPSSRVC